MADPNENATGTAAAPAEEAKIDETGAEGAEKRTDTVSDSSSDSENHDESDKDESEESDDDAE